MENDTHAFIIRVWHEANDSEGKMTAWRGSIDHVGANKRLYFQDLNGVIRFIQEQSGIQKEKAESFWRSPYLWIQNEINKLRNE